MEFKKTLALSLGIAGVMVANAAPKQKKAAVVEPAKVEVATIKPAAYGTRYKYGMAGCGPGSMVVKTNKQWPQLGSSMINTPPYPLPAIKYVGGLFGLLGMMQTFAISSGTSNCEAPATGAVAKNYIEHNHEVLEKEIARGNGESIEGLAKIMGCPDTHVLGDTLRLKYSDLFTGDKTQNATKIIQSAPATCEVHG